ncbi:HAD family hydrolase [Kineosporia sp. NBRC 101731]|uniref:HAD family hydrolase n=1 Tax=Kineosporia sp. NBRC 101731 TaxID=3032199 RepID=UPI0024A04BA9|nr:HAD family hydrolase [Kineosporia sp. NBRC 101731]GLY30523.1 hydrolase [Kineosporia sp. NBRC 101731]
MEESWIEEHGVPTIEAVLFDLDGTLLDHESAASAALAQTCGLGPDDPALPELLQVWRELEASVFGRFLAGELTFTEQRRVRVAALARHRGLGSWTDEQTDAWFAGYLQAYEAGWRAYDDVAEVVDRLVARGLKLGVVTNGQGDQQRRKLAAIGWDTLTDVVLVSGEVGVSKPDPAIFALACHRLDLPAERVLCVGDRLDLDAAAARDAGLTGVWLDRAGEGEEPGPGAGPGVPVIRGLGELPDLMLLRPPSRWLPPMTRPGR